MTPSDGMLNYRHTATQEDPVVVSDSSDVLSDTKNGELLELVL